MSIITKQKNMHSPAHPGAILRELYLKPMRVTITEAAEALGVSRKHFSAIVNGRVPVTPDMAMRLAVAFATSPGSLSARQQLCARPSNRSQRSLDAEP